MTTVAGLVVGIIALFAYNYLVARVNRVMNSLEMKTMEFMDLLNEPAWRYGIKNETSSRWKPSPCRR